MRDKIKEHCKKDIKNLNTDLVELHRVEESTTLFFSWWCQFCFQRQI